MKSYFRGLLGGCRFFSLLILFLESFKNFKDILISFKQLSYMPVAKLEKALKLSDVNTRLTLPSRFGDLKVAFKKPLIYILL
jgi:hypothetical protein